MLRLAQFEREVTFRDKIAASKRKGHGHHGCNRLATTFRTRFLAGVVRKKLGLNLVSEPGECDRVYRIIDDMASRAKTDRVREAA